MNKELIIDQHKYRVLYLLQKKNKENKFFGSDPDPLFTEVDLRIRIKIKMKWNHNTHSLRTVHFAYSFFKQ